VQNLNKMEDYKCHKCGGEGYKTDGECNVWCKICLGLLEPNKLPIIKDKKIGRNEQCPCNIGKKYKHCCALANER